jgi:uncharacterized protein YqfA (UPF0365 family)
MITKQLIKNALVLEEIIPNGGVHEILTSDGKAVRFFLKKGESMKTEHLRLLVENAELNIAQVPANQRDAMRERVEQIRSKLKELDCK